MASKTENLFKESPEEIKQIIIKVLRLEDENKDKQKPQILDAITTIVKDEIKLTDDEDLIEGEQNEN
jgi:hypothetical protein